MNQKNKIIFLSSVIIGVLTLTLGVTFAIFNFNKTSTNSKLIVGDIYMHYNETNQLVIDNAMPSDTYNSTNYFEFTVDGKNTTTNKDIWYEIVLSHGDNHATRTTRIKDNLLKFTLVEIKDAVETVVVDGKSYQDLTSRRIWVDTINKNTTTEVTHTYRLYMWISNDTIIGNVNQDYTMEEWNDVYASIKVNVTGDFNEKEVPIEATPESCFTYQEIEGGVEITNYDASCGVDVVIPNTINGLDVLSITAHQSEIEGSMISIGGFSNKNLTSVVLPSNLLTIKNGTFSGNRLTSVEIPDSVTTIGSHTFKNNQLTNIIIPDSVTTIGKHAFYGNQLTSVTIGSGIQYIDRNAFYKYSYSNPNLSSITINRSCSDIKNIPASSTDSTEYYPWLSDSSSYTASGVTIYGTGSEVCDSY